MSKLFDKYYLVHEKKDSEFIYNYFINHPENFFSPLSKRTDIKKYASKLAKNAEQIWLYCNGELKGFMAFYNNISFFGYLTTISMAPQCRGIGIGKKMMQLMEEISKKNFIPTIRLEVEKDNKYAISFYQKLGYHISKEKKDSYIMEKDLRT